jgi:hypothetical protein
MLTSSVMVFGLTVAGRRAVRPEADSQPDEVTDDGEDGGGTGGGEGPQD